MKKNLEFFIVFNLLMLIELKLNIGLDLKQICI